eukprot:2066999-Amphidinium_carterae.1
MAQTLRSQKFVSGILGFPLSEHAVVRAINCGPERVRLVASHFCGHEGGLDTACTLDSDASRCAQAEKGKPECRKQSQRLLSIGHCARVD